jgi:hypothetical protein
VTKLRHGACGWKKPSQRSKRKHPSAIAFDRLHSEIEAHLSLLRDMKLARSIALAIDTDAGAIAEPAAPEEHARDDRDIEMQFCDFINDNDDLNEAGPSRKRSTAAPRRFATTASSTRVIDEPEHKRTTLHKPTSQRSQKAIARV